MALGFTKRIISKGYVIFSLFSQYIKYELIKNDRKLIFRDNHNKIMRQIDIKSHQWIFNLQFSLDVRWWRTNSHWFFVSCAISSFLAFHRFCIAKGVFFVDVVDWFNDWFFESSWTLFYFLEVLYLSVADASLDLSLQFHYFLLRFTQLSLKRFVHSNHFFMHFLELSVFCVFLSHFLIVVSVFGLHLLELCQFMSKIIVYFLFMQELLIFFPQQLL